LASAFAAGAGAGAGLGAISSWLEHPDSANITDTAATPVIDNRLFILPP